jgi:hypothetical protein
VLLGKRRGRRRVSTPNGAKDLLVFPNDPASAKRVTRLQHRQVDLADEIRVCPLHARTSCRGGKGQMEAQISRDERTSCGTVRQCAQPLNLLRCIRQSVRWLRPAQVLDDGGFQWGSDKEQVLEIIAG